MVSKAEIKEAIKERSDYIKAQLESLTLKKFRRLLEEDLSLEQYDLDNEKDYIKDKVDEVIKVILSAQREEKLQAKAKERKRQRKEPESEQEDESEEGPEQEEDEESESEEVQNGNGSVEDESEDEKSAKKVTKRRKIEVSDNEEEEEEESEEEKPKRRSAKPQTPKTQGAYLTSKRVVELKDFIKQCGLSISPAIYKKAKDAPENKAESTLIDGLVGILKREGLSSNPSERDIKRVREEKDRQKELEGIDMSNILDTGRPRRGSAAAKPPPKYVEDVGDESDEGEKEEGSEEGESDDDEEVFEESDDD